MVTQRKLSGLAIVAVISFLGCASTPPPLPEPYLVAEPGSGPLVESLYATINAITARGSNLGRRGSVIQRASDLGLDPYLRTEGIDWFSLQSNVIIELPGRTDELVYVVAHYDKVDANLFALVSVLLNGVLDELVRVTYLTQGAIDNATGVAVVLEAAARLRDQPRRYTYRFLLTGSEESGLRGARAHVARLPRAEKDAILFAANLDTIGTTHSKNCVFIDVSDPELVEIAYASARRTQVALSDGTLPGSASSDFAPFARTSFWRDFGRGLMFNLVGGLLPQRSWFTGYHEAPVINFSTCQPIDNFDRFLSGLVPAGQLHGPRDNQGKIDPVRLYEQYVLLVDFLDSVDANGDPWNQ